MTEHEADATPPSTEPATSSAPDPATEPASIDQLGMTDELERLLDEKMAVLNGLLAELDTMADNLTATVTQLETRPEPRQDERPDDTTR